VRDSSCISSGGGNAMISVLGRCDWCPVPWECGTSSGPRLSGALPYCASVGRLRAGWRAAATASNSRQCGLARGRAGRTGGEWACSMCDCHRAYCVAQVVPAKGRVSTFVVVARIECRCPQCRRCVSACFVCIWWLRHWPPSVSLLGCAGRLCVALAGPATAAGRACRNCWRLVRSRAGWRGGV